VVVVQIFVTQAQRINPLLQETRQRVAHQMRRARIDHAPRHFVQQTYAPVHLS
jgi:hypothetical protein